MMIMKNKPRKIWKIATKKQQNKNVDDEYKQREKKYMTKRMKKERRN